MRGLLRQDGWFIKACTFITNIVLLNVLFVISSLPILTIGAAMTASFSVGMKIVRQEDGRIIHDYWQSFRKNLKQATQLFSLFLVSFALILVDLMVINQMVGFTKIIFSLALIFFSLIVSVLLVFSFGYLSRYQVTIKQLCLNCFYLALRYPVYSITLILLNGLVWLSIISSPVGLLTGIYLVTFGGAALLVVVNSWFLLQVFSQLEKDQQGINC